MNATLDGERFNRHDSTVFRGEELATQPFGFQTMGSGGGEERPKGGGGGREAHADEIQDGREKLTIGGRLFCFGVDAVDIYFNKFL